MNYLTTKLLRKEKLQNGITLLLFLLGVACILDVAVNLAHSVRRRASLGDVSCIRQSLPVEASDEHMIGLLDFQRQYQVLTQFYKCNEVSRNDLVYFDIGNNIGSVVRVVRGLPGDKFEVIKVADAGNDKLSHWQVKINGVIVMGADGPIEMRAKFDPPLRTYQISRNGVLQNNEFLVFSNRASSLSDSTNLGIVGAERFIGKVQ